MFELLTPEEMARADRLTMEGGIKDGFALMLAAGRAVADIAQHMFPQKQPVAVLCGPGNNGGDGYVAAQYLLEAGYEAVCFAAAPPRQGTDAMRASIFYKGQVRDLNEFSPVSFGGIIDALYGAGLARAVEGAQATVIDAVNASGLPVVAVDLPSGISGATGMALGAAMRAKATVTFFRKKPGHLLQPGRAHCGIIHIADIGIPDRILGEINPRVFENSPELWADSLPSPAVDAHKYSRGHAAVFSGAMHSTGAARLSAMAAARSGTGAVTLLSPPDALAVNAAHLTSIMVRETRSQQDAAQFITDRKVTAAVLGPGYGNPAFARDYTKMLLSAASGKAGQFRGLVLDADGITAFENKPDELFDTHRSSATALVLTPHEGEFKRLFPDIAEDNTSKIDKARKAAMRANAVVIYKGPDTVIAEPGGLAVINSNGTPFLATAGSGDVLTGIVCGLLAQGMAPFAAACASVWVHADAARRFGHGLIAEDLPAQLSAVWSSLSRFG
ncbi:bifunctional ADP-dependent NAD(P)H-hydrate dehydratase/NAD(P)H-hydrate epimerase [Brucella abortus]|uniref:bifunctional ADP-dependent NAD(P)H-hydrate dehydratase/NAD(P)H-hydrate epimerase n=1 Tax=Brucella abortus TaxID=235 RepID=UPI0002CD7DA0|nr:bifunctional ADP-dependent NAD(P)H-hydrate dehydratase/NAD(P)H-hydrate epimerase [Brucella abortus]ENP35628.1 YjeF family domain-containing protein [Brucella abortus 65/110]ENP40958.1 YjeF family domain-containing protein [Brucella abortus 78/36]ENQ04555.1 YjeF family domain-containing protein [Brucella abortus F6/05-2]ENR86727.1 YjeF family domain-containing protein [Brucella abortus 78/14]ENR88526.1 YjeF family domain-containing protein [Brucella abortus 78/32]